MKRLPLALSAALIATSLLGVARADDGASTTTTTATSTSTPLYTPVKLQPVKDPGATTQGWPPYPAQPCPQC